MFIGTQVSREVEAELFDLLAFADSMSYWDKSDGLGCSKSTEFRIELVDEDCAPVRHKLRYLAPHKADFLDKELAKLQELGVLKRCFSEWNSSVVIVPKPGPGDDLRLCADFRDLNERTKAI